MKPFAPTLKDAYKIGHKDQYAPGTEYVYSNLTARSGKHSNIINTINSGGVLWIGAQYLVKSVLIDLWDDTFFNQPKEKVIKKYARRVSNVLGYKVDVKHMGDLHDLGYLPVRVKALPEGSFVPYRVPMLTIVNTHRAFYWVTNMLETMISAESWLMITSATTYKRYKDVFTNYAIETGAPLEGVPFQAHDFSMRGMGDCSVAAISGFAALAAGSTGTDTLPAIDLAEDYYGANSDTELVGMSVNATEHSVMCSNGMEDEIGTFRRLINETYPEGIVSIVSDTWDFWKVVTEYLPALKHDILSRNGKVVIRPDSGDPVDIICGVTSRMVEKELPEQAWYTSGVMTHTGISEYTIKTEWVEELVENAAERKGLVECLWDTFGGTKNEKGFKVLDEHIGAIYGDSITLERQEQILLKLKAKGFCSSNIVLGIGSYTYQHVTRDTHGMAIKATNVVINGENVPIFKDPKTDDGIKKSAKGLLKVEQKEGQYVLVDNVTPEQEQLGCLETIFLDGKLVKETTLKEIRERTSPGCF